MYFHLLTLLTQDDSYGHLAEAIKHSIGEEHEQRIKDELSRLQVPFSDEHLLRSQVSRPLVDTWSRDLNTPL